MKLKFTLIIATLLICFNLTAQTKTGTVNSAYIIGRMPQMNQVLERTNNYKIKLDSIFKSKGSLYNTLVKVYQDTTKTMSDIVRNEKFQELRVLENGLNQFERNGIKLLQLRRDEYMSPLYKKLNDVISQIAKEKGYSQILTINGNQFAYVDEKHDITLMVLAKLGIKEKK